MSITITQSAANKIAKMMIKDHRNAWNTSNLLLRVYVEGGGCSGMQYGFSIEEELQEDDMMIEQHDIKIVVDPFSSQHLDGAVIDYENKLFSSSFIIKNPNAKASCGCGSSFTV